jgi:peptide/nickel transport system permease protein
MRPGLRRFLAYRPALVGVVFLLVVVVMALIAQFAYPRNPLHIVGPPELWPFRSAAHPLGTDAVGRDIAAIIVHGARAALAVGVLATLVSVIVGISVGALGGYFGGIVDEMTTRMTEVFQTIPHIIFVLAVVTVFGASLTVVVLAIGLTNWTSVARVTRAEYLTWRERDFVVAGHAMGMSDARIMMREILPNALPPIVVLVSFTVAAAIMFEAMLAFLGFSDPDLASWGRLIGEGRQSLRTSWYISAIPGVVIMLAVMALNFVGDGLNDALDPRGRRQ